MIKDLGNGKTSKAVMYTSQLFASSVPIPSLSNRSLMTLQSSKEILKGTILSLKEKRVIGYGYREVAQIVHQYFQDNQPYIYQYSGIILRAMEVYYGSVENFIEEAKCGSFRKKWDRFKENNPPQDKTYNEIINAIFPDLNL